MLPPTVAPASTDPWAINPISVDVNNVLVDRVWLVVVSWWHLGTDRNAADTLLNVKPLRFDESLMNRSQCHAARGR